MAFALQTAKRSAAKLKIAIGGASGSGKTLSSLILGYGLLKTEHPDWSDDAIWGKIAVIDTESHSSSLYVGKQVGAVTVGGFQVLDFPPPYEPKLACDAIDICVNAGMEMVIIDSLSHFWIGEGGSLDKQGKIAERTGNSWSSWRSVTPEHNRLVDKMLQSPVHLIACMRAKTAYEQVTGSNGKKAVKSIGMELQMRDGISYEFTTVFMLDYDHVASPSKDRTGMWDDQYFVITPETGKKFAEWLKGSDAKPAPEAPKQKLKPAKAEAKKPAEPEPEPAEEDKPEVTMEMVDAVIRAAVEAGDKKEVFAKVKAIAGVANYTKVTDAAVLEKLYEAFSA